MFTFRPSLFAVPPPSFSSSPSIRATEIQESFCVLLSVLPSSQTGVTWDIAMVVTFGPSQAAIPHHHLRESSIYERESQIS